MAPTSYSIQDEAHHIFYDILLKDPRLCLPKEIHDVASRTVFNRVGTISRPFLPSPLKMVESSTALWALLATFGNVIAEERFGISQVVEINSDAATLFLMSMMLVTVDGLQLMDPVMAKSYAKYDTFNMREPWRRRATNIYSTKDRRFFQLYGSMNASPTLNMLGLAESMPELNESTSLRILMREVRKHDAKWLDAKVNKNSRQGGTICYTPEEFADTEHGEAIANDAIYLLDSTAKGPPPCPWPSPKSGSTFRPLEGIKLIDISRGIAAPTIAKLAALFGATVIRVSCDSQPDVGPCLVDGNIGKRDVSLNLKTERGKAALIQLIQEADVVLDGYRPGALARLGFSKAYMEEVAIRRRRGIVYARLNCYGWKGPYANRSGGQEVSDCITGVSWLQGRLLGLDEPVLPLLPNSDYQ